VADFKLNVTADTDEASRKVGKLDSDVTTATKDRSIKIDVPNLTEINKGFTDLDKNIKAAANDIKLFWKYADFLPGVGSTKQLASNLAATSKAASQAGINVSSAGKTLTSSMDVAARSTSVLTDRLLSVGASVYLVQAAVGALKGAFAGFFNETIGREVELRQTILKTQTTLASTNKVFRNGKEITDPYLKIVSLTGEISKHIESIRERSIALAGVTSNDVIEVFGIVASQVGQIGGGLKDAEDLAISFAAALGTFSLPIYQARQEIGSILRGDIDNNSILAKSLGISSKDIAEAKTKVGGVVQFVQSRLEAAVAGQRIAAEGFSGVVSNLKDLQELVGQQFGAGLLDPLLDGLTKVFDFLFSIKSQLFAIAATSGKIVGSGIATVFGQVQGRSKLAQGAEGGTQQALAGAKDEVTGIASTIQSAMSPVIGQLTTLLERAAIGIAIIVKGLGNLAKGFLSLQLANLQAAIGAIETLSQVLVGMAGAVSGALSAWGGLLQLPLVQEFSRIQTIFGVISKTGLPDIASKVILVAGAFVSWKGIVAFVTTQFIALRTIFATIVLSIGQMITSIGNFGIALANTALRGGAAMQALAIEIKLISAETQILGQYVQRTGDKMGGLGKGIEKVKGGLTGMAVRMVLTNVALFALQAAIAVGISLYTKWKEKQDEIATDRRADEALRRLSTTYKDLGENATAAQKRARDFEQALVNAQYTAAIERLEKIRQKLQEINDLRSGSKKDFGDYIRQIGQLLNPDNLLVSQKPGETFSDAVYRKQEEEEKKAKTNANKWGNELDKKSLEDDIKLQAQKRTDLSKEIAELERSHADKLFQTRQQAASKEVEIFRASGELRIFQMEQANKKLIEGEEGASAAALDALNTYLATRERGELDIEASKKSLAIEIIGLERSVMDYKLDMEKKIAEIRKRSNENDVKTADYRKQLIAATGKTGLLQGSTGAVTGPHFHVQGAGTEAEARSIFANAGDLTTTDRPGSPRRGGRTHAGYDLAGPANTPLNLSPGYSLESFVRDKGIGGNYANIAGPEGKKYQVMHLQDPGADYKVQSAAPVKPPEIKGNLDIKSDSVYAKDYAGALKQVTGAMERLQVIQKALTDAKTAADFQVIAKAAFPKVQLEGYRDEIIKAEESLKKLAGTTAEAYDPEKLQIQADLQAKIKIADLEREEIMNKAKANQKVTQKELAAIEKQLQEKRNQTIIDLRKEATLREDLLKKQRQQKAIEDLLKITRDVGFNTQREAIAIQGRMASAYAGNDPAAARRIQAESDIANKRIELKQQGLSEAEVIAQLRDFAEKTRAAAEQLGKLDIAAQEYQTKMAMLNEAVQTIIGAQKTAIKSILKGGDIKEAMQTMANSMADKFLDMTLDAVFKPLEKQMTDQLKKMFGLEDPAQKLQAENNAALQSNTQALQLVASALSGGGVGGNTTGGMVGNVLQGAETIGSFFQQQPKTNQNSPYSQFFSSAQLPAVDMKAYTTPGINFGTMGNTNFNFSAAADKAEKDTKKTNDNLNKLLGGIGGFAMGIMSIYSGIQSMKSGGASGWLIGIGSVLSGIGGAIGGLGTAGLFGKKAGGGAVSSGRPYMIGEMGPEMFVPNTGGTVVPTSNLRAAMGADYGGGMATPVLNMSFESTTINGVEYVSRDQLEAAMAQTRKQAANDGARRGMNMTIDRLQQSPNTRRRVGMR
jgi:hypothetical protein